MKAQPNVKIPKPTPSRSTEFFLLGVLATLWGGSYLLIKVALETIPPTTLMATRVSVAGFILLVLMY